MITLNGSRNLDSTKRVQVYRNLTKDMWSVRQGGKVIGWAEEVLLKDAEFVCNKAGRERVRKTGRKNVHAYISGKLISTNELKIEYAKGNLGENEYFPYCVVTYNPYNDETFIDRETGEPILVSDFASLNIHDETIGRVIAIFKGEPQQW